MSKAASKSVELRICSAPHNGAKQYRTDDPVEKWPDGSPVRIGGQIRYIRTAIRRKRFVAPLGRRCGKTTTRPFLWAVEGQITKGPYNAGYISSNHTKAWESFVFARDQLGPRIVKQAVGEPESQNRYLELNKFRSKENPEAVFGWAWNDPVVGPKIRSGWNKNEGGRIYFWSGQHPIYTAIQGFVFKFDRISVDEAQQIHPGITRIVSPMLMDSGGSLDVSGIPDIDAPGNTWFEDYYQRGLDPKRQKRWACINFPSYDNPFLDKEALAEIQEDLITEDDFRQYILAEFISGSGAVFGNLDKVFVLPVVWKREQPADKDGPAWWRDLFLREPSDVIRTWIHEVDPTPGHHYAMTVDFAGRTKHRDATFIEVFDMTENKMVCAVSIRGMRSPGQLTWIEGIKDHYEAHEVHGDETPEGAALMGYLRERYKTGVIGHNFTSSNKAEYVKRGQFLFEMEEVRLIDCDEIRTEFRIFKRIVSESLTGRDGPVTYSHPPGKHDDAVTSFLQIAPYMAHGRRAVEAPDEKRTPLLDDAGLLNLDPLNEDLRDDLAESDESVRVRVPRN